MTVPAMNETAVAVGLASIPMRMEGVYDVLHDALCGRRRRRRCCWKQGIAHAHSAAT